MNRYQKYLNTRAKRLFKSDEKPFGYSYRDCRIDWNYALNNIGHYIIILEAINIIKRNHKRIWI